MRVSWLIVLLIAAAIAWANDVVYLSGRVRLEGGAQPGRSVEIQLSCKGADHAVRQVVTNKKGAFFLKVERDEFNHVARALPTTAMDVQNDAFAGSCKLIAALPGYTSSAINLTEFTIGKDLKLPDLILTPRKAN